MIFRISVVLMSVFMSAEAFSGPRISNYLPQPYLFGFAHDCPSENQLPQSGSDWDAIYEKMDEVIGAYGELSEKSNSFDRMGNIYGLFAYPNAGEPRPELKTLFAETYPTEPKKIGDPGTTKISGWFLKKEDYTRNLREARVHFGREIADIEAFKVKLAGYKHGDKSLLSYLKEHEYAIIIGYEGALANHEIQHNTVIKRRLGCACGLLSCIRSSESNSSTGASAGEGWDAIAAKYFIP